MSNRELTQFIESYRALQVDRLHKMTSFAECWKVWEPQILAHTANLTDANSIYALGSKLSDIFRSTGGGGRDQGSLSGGGAAWEALVCWYLNLVFTGTRAIAFKQNKQLIPNCIFDAATVTYGNHQTNTESDISVIIIPQSAKIVEPSGTMKSRFENLITQDFAGVTLGIVQCKTNWNDNAQIPMLWDMVYKAMYPEGSGVRVGRNGYSIKHLNFSYSFVVVPSQKKPIKQASTAAVRVNALSGGNYWGQPSQSGVALSLSEIFMHSFSRAFDSNVIDTIKQSIQKKIGPYA